MLPELIRMACTAYGAWGNATGGKGLTQVRALDFGGGPFANYTVRHLFVGFLWCLWLCCSICIHLQKCKKQYIMPIWFSLSTHFLKALCLFKFITNYYFLSLLFVGHPGSQGVAQGLCLRVRGFPLLHRGDHRSESDRSGYLREG